MSCAAQSEAANSRKTEKGQADCLESPLRFPGILNRGHLDRVGFLNGLMTLGLPSLLCR